MWKFIMENGFYLCLFFLFCSGVTSQSVTITEDTVYVKKNAIGQVTCTLYGNCGAIDWYLSSIQAPVASTFIGVTCKNTSNEYFQTCDYQNHQYTLYFTGTTNLHGQTIRCSGDGCTPQQTVSDTATISIIVPVPSVALEGFSGQQITVTAGQSKSITCVIPTKSQNGLQINCKAYNTDNNMVEVSTKPTLNVQYASASISYQPGITPYTKNEGENLGPIQCVSDCNPKCNFVWTSPGQSDYIGENLTISSIIRIQEGDYKCTTSNNYGSLYGSKISVVVNYGPDPATLTPSTNNYSINETFPLGPIKCSATCKPSCSYKWIRPNQNAIQGDTLTINSIQRTQTGTYKCQAYNTVGTRNSNYVFVIVHYAAKLTNMEISGGNNFIIPEHSTKTITCLAEGLPQPKITLSNISNSSIIKSVNGRRLDFTFLSARCEDTGVYKCDAINKFTPQQPLQKGVFVLCQPRATKESLQNWYILSVGKTLNITVPYLAYPKPTFQWFKNDSGGSLIPITNDEEDIQINNSFKNPYTFVIQLIKRNIKEDGFGNYILISNNTVNGPKEDVYIVRAKGKPKKPRDGQAMCIDYRSAVITWKPGFFNGDNQTFSVVYQEKGGTEQISVSNISDPGQDKYINFTVNSLQGAKTYFFTIYSRNMLGKSPPLEVNCSTKANTNKRASTISKAVGAGLGSIIALVIISVIVIYFLRRYQTKVKGETDNQVCDSNKKEHGKFGVRNETATNSVFNDEDANENINDTATNRLNYEILQMPNDQQPYEQIKMQDTYEDISRIDTNKLNYEILRTLNDEQPYEQINLEGKLATADADRDVYVNTAIR